MKKDNLTISYSELMKTLDNFRALPTKKQRVLTKEQISFLTKSREHKDPIPFKIMARLWEQVGWGKMNQSTMRNIYVRDFKGGKA